MRNLYPYCLAVLLLCAIFSCKKGDSAGGKNKKSALIAGKWLVYQRHTLVYDLESDNLLKDTTIAFAAKSTKSWYEIYNTDGTAYVTSIPYLKNGATTPTIDTTAYLTYSILGSNLVLKQTSGGSKTLPILNLTLTNMVLQSSYVSPPKPGWGLVMNVSYKFTEETSYNKQ